MPGNHSPAINRVENPIESDAAGPKLEVDPEIGGDNAGRGEKGFDTMGLAVGTGLDEPSPSRGLRTTNTGSSGFPDRPRHSMHCSTLPFCILGMPSGENEDIDCRLCKEDSGPRGDRTPNITFVGSEDGNFDRSFSTQGRERKCAKGSQPRTTNLTGRKEKAWLCNNSICRRALQKP